MKKIIQALGILTFAIFIGNACNKPSNIGEDLLPNEDFIDVLFTDSLELSTSSIQGDRVQTYTATLSQQLSYYLCGRLDDPICGESTSEIITQFGIGTKPGLNEPVLDSIILTLAYAPSLHAGNIADAQSFDVYRIEQDLYSTSTYFSTDTFEISERIGGIEDFTPRVDENTLVRFPYYDSSNILQSRDSLIAPHLRIPLDMSFGEEVLEFVADTTFFGLSDEFTQFLKGINIRPHDDNTAMLRFDLRSALSEIRLYYHEEDTIVSPYRTKEIVFPIRTTSVKALAFDHNFDDAIVSDFLDTTSNLQDFTFVQSMEGLGTRIEFPGLEELKDIAINQAELVVTVVRNSDLDEFPLPERLAAFQRNADGDFNAIQDVINAVETNNGSLFGGAQTSIIRNGEKITQYRMFATSFLQGIVDKKYDDNSMYLLPFDRGQQATRVVLGGSNHDHYPIELRLTYTKLNE